MTLHRILTIAAATSMTLGAAAQSTASGYFNDGFLYRHHMNPAIVNSQSYIAMPFLGNVYSGAKGSFGIGDVLYSRQGETVTFMHPGITSAEALKHIHDINKFEVDERMSLLDFGFKTKKGYLTIGLDLRSNVGLSLPGEFFRLAKEGPANKTYDISNLTAHADAMGELGVGYARKVGKNLQIGAKAKVLIGAANFDLNSHNTRLELGEDVWRINADIEAQGSLKGLQYIEEIDEETHKPYIDDIDVDGSGISGFGVAFDLGALYTVKDFKIGLAVNDLGAVKWNNNMLAECRGNFTTDGRTFSVDKDDINNFEDEFERFGDDLADAFEFVSKGDQGGRSRGLAATINASVEYTLPAYRKLTFGLLSTTRLQGARTWTDARLSANLAPAKWFSLSLTGGYGTFGPSFGWMVNLHPKGFSLFAGMDGIGAPYGKYMVPLGHSSSLNFGVNFPF